MVSKSNLQRKPDLVFISTGSTDHQFSRLAVALDHTASSLTKQHRIVFQGITKIARPEWRIVESLSEKNLQIYMNQARYCIVHGGPASIYLATKYCPFMPFIAPRLHQFHEHIDNHQLFFCTYLATQLPAHLQYLINTDPNLLEEQLRLYFSSTPRKNELAAHLFPKPSGKTIGQAINKLVHSWHD